MRPGSSPVRLLGQDTGAARARRCAVFASAGAIAIGRYTLPVYEIYKAGHDLHWQDGLDLFGPFGLNLAFVSHWNNGEGGADLDTSHCFMGKERFDCAPWNAP